MPAAMAEDMTDREVLAELARGEAAGRDPALEEALHGRFGPHHALIVEAISSELGEAAARSKGTSFL
ncbi:MAG TPA: hypothetical protein VNJ71_09475, partial [Gemmatimonadales bacterium]|nr:hypothetical protein [Gemmatimonadales bacterium]